MPLTISRGLLVGALCLLAGFRGAAEAAWPERTITLMHGFGAGGNADVIARIVADRLSARLGQPVVVDNVRIADRRTAARYPREQR